MTKLIPPHEHDTKTKAKKMRMEVEKCESGGRGA